MKFSQDAQVFIRQVKETLDKLKPKIYSEKLLEIDKKEEEFEEGKIGANEYIEYLTEVGAEFYSARTFRSIKNRPLHINIVLLQETLELEKKIEQQKVMKESKELLLSLQSLLSENKNKSEMEMLLAKASLFREQKIAPFSFYSYLEELAKRYLKDDIDGYPNLFSFVEYLDKVNSLDSARLFQEIEELAYEIKDHLSTNEKQKLITRSLRHIKFLENFFDLKVSNEELDYYLTSKDDFKVAWFRYTITSLTNKTNSTNQTNYIDFNPDLIDKNLPALEHFYDIARERDIAMVNNTLAEVEKRDAKVAALISGGFHTRGITGLLKEKGCSYVVISPYSSSDIDEENYHYLLSGERKPLSELVNELNNLLRIPLGFVNKRFRDAYFSELLPLLMDKRIPVSEQESLSDRVITLMVGKAVAEV